VKEITKKKKTNLLNYSKKGMLQNEEEKSKDFFLFVSLPKQEREEENEF
jgi:hypothetical protein